LLQRIQQRGGQVHAAISSDDPNAACSAANRREIRVEAPVWTAGMAKESREWVGFSMPLWRDSVAQVV